MSDDQLVEMYGLVRETNAIVKNGLLKRVDANEASISILMASHASLAASHTAMAVAHATHLSKDHAATAERKVARRDTVRTVVMVGSLLVAVALGVAGLLS